VTAFLSSLPGPLVLLVAALLLIPESGLAIGFFLPGTTVLFALGFAAHAGLVPLWAALPAAAAGAVIGPQVGYLRGRRRRHVRPRWLDRLPGGLFVRVEDCLLRRPTVSIVCGQWLASARMLTPWLAGRLIGWRRFTIANVPSAVVWSTGLVSVGYVVGIQVTQQLNLVLTVAGVAVAVLAIGYWLLRRRRVSYPYAMMAPETTT
jgi:membrane protein DedA with SNARE-associated domain